MITLDDLWQRGREFLGVRYPIIAGAMTWISDSAFVSRVAEADAFGCLAAGNMEPEKLKAEIVATRRLTSKPFAVNLVTIAPNYQNHLKLACDLQVPFIVFAGGYPRQSEIKLARESGARVLAFAPTEAMARRLVESGADALILEGSEAGGHIGHVSLIILLQQVLFRVDTVPIFVAGGIATGQLILHLLLMGAAGVQLGTYFAVTEESRAHPRFKQALCRAQAREAVATPQVGSELKVISVRALQNKGMETFTDLQLDLIQKRKKKEISHEEAQYLVESFWVGALRRAVEEGDIERGSVMAGQSVGLISRVRPLREALAALREDAEAEWRRVQARLGLSSLPSNGPAFFSKKGQNE
ncbi:MAG: NAD(P)H-dependent flavin oxidoreductase [Candidatus Aminicenantales bacterium]